MSIRGVTLATVSPRDAVNSSALSNSSIQGVVNAFPMHCLQMGRETQSALQ